MRVARYLAALMALTLSAGCTGDAASPPGTVTPPTTSTGTPPPPVPTVAPTTPVSTLAPTTPPVPSSTAAPATTEPATLVDAKVYLLRGERLAIAHRDVAAPAVLRGALESLLGEAVGQGLSSAIPPGTELLGVDLDDGLATVDLSGRFESGGGTLSLLARVGQIVFTATQFDNVERVAIWLDGAPVDAIGGEGLAMDEPWTRAMVPWEFTGGVLVDTPRPGDTVTSPFVVTGEADVFEGEFPIEIRRDGAVLATVTGVRGGAWGEWAEFTVSIAVDAPPGPIELVARDAGGCGDDPECPAVVETVVELVLAG